MRLLVLGHTGFVGAAVLRRLRARGAEAEGLSTAQADLSSRDGASAVARAVGPSTVVVLASSLTLDRHPDSLELFQKNVDMATGVATMLSDARPAKLVYLSSFVVYGHAEALDRLDEESPTGCLSYYAASKLAGERVLTLAAKAAGVPLLTLRLGRIYGPGAPGAGYGPDAFCRALAEGRRLEIFGDGAEKRDHLFIDDTAELIDRLASSENTGVLNLVSGEAVGFLETVELLRKLSPRPVETAFVTRNRPVARIPPFDASRLRAAVPGFTPVPFAEGLRRSFESRLTHA